jgi:hypothetical protein
LNLFQFQCPYSTKKNELLITKAKFKTNKFTNWLCIQISTNHYDKKKSASEKTIKISNQPEFAVMGSTEKSENFTVSKFEKKLGNSLLKKI